MTPEEILKRAQKMKDGPIAGSRTETLTPEVPEMKAAPAAEPSTQNLLAESLIGILPALIGYGVGGASGGEVGAKAGLTGLGKIEEGRKTETAAAQKKAELEREDKWKQATVDHQNKTQAETERNNIRVDARTRENNAANAKNAAEKNELNRELGSIKNQLAEKKGADRLPVDSQEVVKDLSKKNAHLMAIKNEIDSTLEKLSDKKLSDQQRAVVGRSLIKTLNSTQGQDAVGAEEAKRLGGLLEYSWDPALKGFTSFGPNHDAFRDQVSMTSQKLGDTLKANAGYVDQIKSGKSISDLARQTPQSGNQSSAPGPSIGPTSAQAAQPSAEDMQALQWAQANPNDPRSAAILQANGVK